MNQSVLRCLAILLAAAGVATAGEAFVGRDGSTVFFDPWVQFINVKFDPQTASLRFDVYWEESWRNELNHDAAWVFFKVRANPQSPWQHLRLAANKVMNPKGYGQAEIAPRPPPVASPALPYYRGRDARERIGGLESDPDTFGDALTPDTRLEFLVPDGADGFTGVFLRRAEPGSGTAVAHGVTVVPDLTSLKGVADLAKADIRPLGLLMVYVAEGPFYVGTGGNEANAFYAYDASGTQAPPYRVAGPDAIPTGKQAGRLWARGAQPEDGGEVPAAFPTGYRAFYCMKKHITNHNWSDFLDTLTAEQSNARYYAKAGRVERAGTPPNYTYKWHYGGPRDGSGMRWLSWEDGCGFAAWAGLRPLTELEWEKAVRGFRLPVADEVGPSYWGIGAIGCWPWDAIKSWECQCERAVSVGHAKGRAFKGTHGNGTLALPTDWPQADAVGSGWRYKPDRGLASAAVSDRLGAATADPERRNEFKFRCARTAPKEAAP